MLFVVLLFAYMYQVNLIYCFQTIIFYSSDLERVRL